MNLTIKPGQTVALVGSSGSGKSTLVRLLERFFDPVSGQILIDSHDIRSLNVHWLRQQIGIVSQEPVLFNTSIRENISYGIPDKYEPLEQMENAELKQVKIQEMIQDALKKANAWDFVQKLPQGIDTLVGESGSLLSGGQKVYFTLALKLATYCYCSIYCCQSQNFTIRRSNISIGYGE
jgi:ABC-type multidrug transport system fused ATPase/permease subunit